APWLGVPDAAVQLARGCNIHPHNYWLELATSGGWPLLLGFAVLSALWLGRMLRGLRAEAEPMRAAVLVMLAVQLWPFAAHSSLFVVDAGGFVFLAAAWGLAETGAETGASERQADAGA
ncbi:MAG TPA: O-antigen ligase family protein, partial [Acetobacteraceae bacterium]|nr:O-antigen ligase family protein [Acetobacteraceae bacterium]